MDELTLDHSKRLRLRREDGSGHRWALARKVALGLSLALACQCALAQAMYRIKPLGTLGGCTGSYIQVFGLNGHDEVTGQTCNANGDGHAFLWKNNGTPMVDLGPDEIGSTSEGRAINASGLVTGLGRDSTGYFAFVSSGDGAPMKKIPNGIGGSSVDALAINDLGQVTGGASAADRTEHAFHWRSDGSPMRDLGSLAAAGYPEARGSAINASGQVAGQAGDGDRNSHAFVWKNDGTPMLDLGTLGGYTAWVIGINAPGELAGNSATGSFRPIHGFLWRNDGTGMHDLGTLGGAETYVSALNNSGQIAGYSNTLRFLKPHAFVWMNDGTPMKNLGTLGGTSSFANDINASGQVTGDANLAGDTVQHAFLWRNDGTKIQDLNKLIDPTDPRKPYVTLTNGEFINDLSDIVARAPTAAQGCKSCTCFRGPY